MFNTINVPSPSGKFNLTFDHNKLYLYCNDVCIIERDYDPRYPDQDLIGTIIDVYNDILYRLVEIKNEVDKALLLSCIPELMSILGQTTRFSQAISGGSRKQGINTYVINGVAVSLHYRYKFDSTRTRGTAKHSLKFTKELISFDEYVEFNWGDKLEPLNAVANRMFHNALERVTALSGRIYDATRGPE